MITLMQDQVESLNKVILELRAGTKKILLQGETGSGKSIIGSEIVRRTLAKDNEVWFCVPRKDLLDQMSRTFGKFEIPHSFLAAGRSMNPHSKCYIASLDTLKSRLDKVRPPKLCLIDETHFGGEGLNALIEWLDSHGVVIIGLSATPKRLDGKGLGRYYQKLICGPTIRELINMKRLADYRAFAPSHPDLSKIGVSGGEYSKKDLNDYYDSNSYLIGNAVSHYKSHAYGRLGVTFAVSVKESQKLAQAYRDAGIPAAHMDGETPMDERRQIARAFAKRELLQLCNAELLTFGYDLSSVSGIDNARIECITDCQPTKSLAKQRQKNGRGLRYGEEDALLFDHANNFMEHGLPCAEIPWDLADDVKSPRGATERANPVVICLGCFFTYSPLRDCCPSCGVPKPRNEREIKQIEGELMEIQIMQEKKEKRMEVGQAKTLEDLRRIQKDRGYHHGWVNVQAKLKRIFA